MKLSQKEAAELRREKGELEQKRLTLKEKCKNHRDMSTEEVSKTADELRSMSDRLDEINDRLKDAPEPEQRGGLAHLKNHELTQENYRSSSQYRDAFFRSFMNGKVAEPDAEIMSMGKRAITDMNGLSVASGAEYLVPQTTMSMIQSIITKYGRLYSKITKYGFNGDVTIPIGTANAPTNEADGTDTLSFTFTEATINQQAIIATISVKNILLKNSISGLEGYLAMEIGKYIGLQLENYIIVGNPATSKFTGIKTAITAAPSAAKTYSAIDWTLLNEVQGSVDSPYGDDGTWIMNRKTFFAEFRSITDANGNPLVTTAPVVAGSPTQYYIDARPVELTTRMADGEFAYGDLSQYIINESQELVIEADASAGFAADKTIWRGKVYAGGLPMFAKVAFAYYTKA